MTLCYGNLESITVRTFLNQRFEIRKATSNITVMFNSPIKSMGITPGSYEMENFSVRHLSKLSGNCENISIEDISFFNAFREVLNNPANSRLAEEFDRMVILF